MKHLPLVSIVMPTFNRVDLMTKQLEAFARQTMPAEQFEIIVVDDGSGDATAATLEAWRQRLPNLRPITQRNQGPAIARNTGVAAARAEYIAFTDDDCIVSDTWVEAVHRAFERSDAIVLQGKTVTQRHLRTPLTHQIENLGYRNLTVTCNAAIRRSVFQQVGGFSTAFPAAHNEDTELTWRLNPLGRIEFVEDMEVLHPPIPKAFKSQVRRMRLLASEFTLYRLHPEAYRRHRQRSPWLTIYYEVGVYHFVRNLKFALGFYRRPYWLFTGLALYLVSELYLLSLLPYFLKAGRQ